MGSVLDIPIPTTFDREFATKHVSELFKRLDTNKTSVRYF